MKLVIIGGSACGTPALFLTGAMQPLLDSMDVVLVGRSVPRLRAVRRALQVLTPSLHVSFARDSEAAGALSHADILLVQARFGGMQGRMYDETFPREYEVPGDEGLGPGGLSAAWRTWPPLKRVLAAVDAHASQAAVIAMTAPLGILTRCVLDEFPRLRWHAVCELPYATLLGIARAIALTVDRLRYAYAGVNHLGWFDRLADARDDSDVLPSYAATLNDDTFPTRALVERYAAVPLKYERLVFDRERVLAEQRQSSRASLLMKWQERCFQAFETGTREQIVTQLRLREMPWYELAVAPLIAALSEQSRSEHFFLTTRNDGYIDALPSDDVIEVPYVCINGEMQRIERRRNISPEICNGVERLVRYEEAAAAAVRRCDADLIAPALALHPWVPLSAAEALARLILHGPASQSDSMQPALQHSL